MTVHQLHYTSCEDGLEGIQGFQISALTPGAPKPLVDLAVRASAYELGPSLGARVADDYPESFPVKFGYVPNGQSAAVFQSRYLGADFTGRMGNYFAHALLLDDADRELDGALPIDLWQSPTWVHKRQNGTSLPIVTNVAPGAGVGPDGIRRLLAQPNAAGRLAKLIGATQRVLLAGRGRVVLVANDDRESALWLATLCRSFPRPLGLEISFVTYTSRPEDSDALVSCTLPDVRLPAYGDFTPVDMTGGEPGTDGATCYGRLLALQWVEGTSALVVALGDQVTPPLAAADLDTFAALVALSSGGDTDAMTEATVLDAMAFAGQRQMDDLQATAWTRVADIVVEPTDLTRWSEVLAQASTSQYPPPVGLLGRYYLVAVAAPGKWWLPDLDPAAVRDIAERTVLPALLGDQDAPVLANLADLPDLASATVAALDRQLADSVQLHKLATVVRPQAARLINRVAGPSSSSRLLADLVLARHDAADPIEVLVRAAGANATEWWELGSVLWPGELTTPQAAAALRRLPDTILMPTGLAARISDLAMRLARQGGELTVNDVEFVDDVLGSALATELDQFDVAMLRAARLISHFRNDKPARDAVQEAWEGLELAAHLPTGLGGQLRRAIAEHTMRLAGTQHAELLYNALDQDARRFLPAYREVASTELRKAAAVDIATMIVIWRGIQDRRLRQLLIEEDLPDVLARRGSRYLDKVGTQLPSSAHKLKQRGQGPKGGWSTWWGSWRSVHEQRGFFARFGLRGRR